MQGHLGGHWLPSISINHPFQFLCTITFKFLNLPCSIQYLLEPSLSDWVRAVQSREERQRPMGPQGPQDRGGGGGWQQELQWSRRPRNGKCPRFGCFLFWLWSLSFLVWSFCWFYFEPGPCFFFNRVYLLDFPWRSLSVDTDSSTSDSLELCFWVRPLGAVQILGLHSVPFSYTLSLRWTQSTFLIFPVNRAQDRKWLCHGWIVTSFFCTGSVMSIYCFMGRPIILASWSQTSVACLKLVATCVIF